MKTGAALLPVILAAGLASGCGPVESVVVINEASAALDAARLSEADRHAPYEFTSAELYLDKAREERGYADYQVAVQYGRQARDLARQARRKAREILREDVPTGEQSPAGRPGTEADDEGIER